MSVLGVFSPFRQVLAVTPRVELREQPAASPTAATASPGPRDKNVLPVVHVNDHRGGDVRETLRQAIDAAAGAEHAASTAAEIAQRAEAETDRHRAAVERFADLPAAVTEWRASIIRGGGTAAGASLPDGLRRRRNEHDAAARELADAEATRQLLMNEAQSAAVDAAAAKTVVQVAIHAVADAEAAQLAGALQATELQAARLRESLSAFSQTRAMNAPRSVPAAVLIAVQMPWGQLLLEGHAHRGMPTSAPAWVSFRRALEG